MKSRLLTVAVFAAAMAWAEAAVVLDLRVLVDRLQPYQPDPLPHFGGLGGAEIIREAATLLMLLTVGYLTGERGRSRLAYSAFAFGVWDVLYYLFLIPLTGWPRSLLDWDILFLIPLPWWGPVLAPVSIALLMIAGGLLAVALDRSEQPACLRRRMWLVAIAGAGLVLYTFMADAMNASGRGMARAWEVLPVEFRWSVFVIGYGMIAVPVLDMARRFIPVLRKGGSAG